MDKTNITQSKYIKFVKMTKENETVKKIKSELNLTEGQYEMYFNTFVLSTQKRKKKAKEVKIIRRKTIQDGYLPWVTDIFKRTKFYYPHREVI